MLSVNMLLVHNNGNWFAPFYCSTALNSTCLTLTVVLKALLKNVCLWDTELGMMSGRLNMKQCSLSSCCNSDLFPVGVCLCQGCALSPVLFVIFMDRKTKRIHKGIHIYSLVGLRLHFWCLVKKSSKPQLSQKAKLSVNFHSFAHLWWVLPWVLAMKIHRYK